MFDAIRTSSPSLRLLALVGIAGPLVMYMGDLLLYYAPVTMAEFEANMPQIMRERPIGQVLAGGFLGPIAAIGYAAAYLALSSMLTGSAWQKAVILVFWLLAASVGAAYHSQFPHLMFPAPLDAPPGAEFWARLPAAQGHYMNALLGTYLALKAAAWLWFTLLVAFRRSALPRPFALISPLIIFWAVPAVSILPVPFNVLIGGGWFNIMYMPFFVAFAIWVWRKPALS